MKLFDMHAHTSGISECCLGDAETIIKVASENGIDGIVLTNHYQKSYLRNGDATELAKRYTEEYRMTKRFGEKYGVTVIYGMEVTMHRHDNSHLLVYGLPESFTEEFPEVYDMTQEELYTLVKSRGGLLIQAHPFRVCYYPLDPRFLDGYELSSHPLYGTSAYDDVTALVVKHGKLLTTGADYHHDVPYRPYCGAFLPDTVKDPKSLVEALTCADPITLSLHEPENGVKYLVTYSKKDGTVKKEENE
jgi:histidinol phosphatase-like PHP family hydrolase